VGDENQHATHSWPPAGGRLFAGKIMGKHIDKLRLIVKTTEQANGVWRFDDVTWLVAHAADIYREIEALEMLAMPLEHYERIAKTLFMQMDAMLAKASPLIKEEIGKLRDRIAILEAEKAARSLETVG
jgi:hypothetical protein